MKCLIEKHSDLYRKLHRRAVAYILCEEIPGLNPEGVFGNIEIIGLYPNYTIRVSKQLDEMMRDNAICFWDPCWSKDHLTAIKDNYRHLN